MPHSNVAERLVFDLADLGFAEVPVIGRYEYFSAHPGLQTHVHPGVVEICYLERGCQIYRAGGREYHLVGGDLFVTGPGEPHDTGGHAEDRGVLYWLNLVIPRQHQSILLLPAEESQSVIAQLSNLPSRHFAGRPVLKQLFNDVFALCEQPVSPLARVAVSNGLVRLLLEVIDCGGRRDGLHLSPRIARIVDRIKAHPERDYSLTDLAKEAGLSLSRFKTTFKTQTGFAPREFVIRCKVEAAKKLLQSNHKSVTEMAMELGFSSSQYFATVFKRFTHQTPIEFCTKGPAIPLVPATGPKSKPATS